MQKQNMNSTRQQIHLLCMMWAQKAIIVKHAHSYTLTLKGIDPKVLYMTARPSKNRAFITAKKFMTLWAENNNIFENEPPEIAISYTNMKTDTYGVAEAIPIILSHPKQDGEEGNSWTLQLKCLTENIEPGNYDGICLFIDWLPSFECPKPIKLVFPALL